MTDKEIRERLVTASLYERKGTAILGFPVKVRWIDAGGEVGYTVGRAEHKSYVEIFVSWDLHVFTDEISLSDDEKKILRMGIFAHELLHQVLTDFDSTVKLISKRSIQEKSILMNMINLLEDPAIEYQASGVFGGALLKSLKFTIKTIYDWAPDIDESGDAFSQLCNALINFGDMGVIKGHFTFPEALDAFKKIAPLFNEGIEETNPSKRLNIAYQCFEISRPLWESKVVKENDLKKLLAQLSRQLGAMSPSKGKEVPAPKGSVQAKEARKTLIEKVDKGELSLSKDDTKSCDGTPLESGAASDEDAPSEGEGSTSSKDDKSANSGTSKDGAVPKGESSEGAIDDESVDTKKIAAEIEKLLSAEERSLNAAQNKTTTEELDTEILGSALDKNAKVYNASCPFTEGSVMEYKEIVAQNRVQIKNLTRELDKIFLEDKEEAFRSTSGEMNVLRMSTRPASTRIFDRRREGNKKDAEIVLLIDESGSMYGEKIKMAEKTAIIFSEALMALDIPHYIIGFTSDCGFLKEGLRRKMGIDDAGQTADAYYTHYVTWNTCKRRESHYALCNISAKADNYDSHAIRTGAAILKKRTASNKLLIVISDGAPAATIYDNRKQGVKETTLAIKEAKKEASVLGIGIGDIDAEAMKEMYQGGFIHTDTSALTNLLIKRLVKIVKNQFN